MNILSDFEAHKRDEDFDREDEKRHRETCSPAGSCYIPYVANVRGEPHYCDLHRPMSCGCTRDSDPLLCDVHRPPLPFAAVAFPALGKACGCRWPLDDSKWPYGPVYCDAHRPPPPEPPEGACCLCGFIGREDDLVTGKNGIVWHRECAR